MRYRSYLFDFDGTLVDSMPYYERAMLSVLEENGIAYGEDLIKTITPLGYAGTAGYYKEVLGLTLSEREILSDMKSFAYYAYAHKVPIKENVRETLQALASAGADLHILTASPHDVLDICIERLGLGKFFKNVWSTDDFGLSKTDPEIYKGAAERIGRATGEILFLDDNLLALAAAKRAGMPTVGVYDASSLAYAEEIRAAADGYIKDFLELLSL